jgi:mannan endo-1,4-beta-mannosidase
LALEASSDVAACFGCGDDAQAVIWLLRKDSIGRNGMLCTDAKPVELRIRVPGLSAGRYSITGWNTRDGLICALSEVQKGNEPFLPVQVPPFVTDLALAIHRL